MKFLKIILTIALLVFPLLAYAIPLDVSPEVPEAITNPQGSLPAQAPAPEPETIFNREGYILPRFQIPIITMPQFTPPSVMTSEEGKDFVIIDFLGKYLVGIYTYLVGIVGIVAGIMIVWAGVKWLTSAGMPDRIKDAKKKIGNSLIGLVFVLASYVILNTLNSELVTFRPLTIEIVPRIELTAEEKEEEFAEGGEVVTGNICNSIEECRVVVCNKPPEEWPVRGTATPARESLESISTIAGLKGGCQDGCLLTPGALTALKRAAEIAQNQLAPNGPYTIKVTSAFRPLKKQIQLVCNKITCSQNETKCVDKGTYAPTKLGTAIGWPGNPKSGHGVAKGVDVALLDKDGKVVSCSGCYDSQGQTQWKEGANILFNIMKQAGWKRYCKEIWHFEIDSTVPCRSGNIPADKINTISCSADVCPS